MKDEKKTFYQSILVAVVIAGIVSFIPIWQLVILAGLFAGNFHNKIKQGVKSGAAGMVIYWGIFITYKLITINAYLMLDQFASLLSIYGWIILIIIILMGAVLGALGGAIGSEMRILMDESFYSFLKKKLAPSSKEKKPEIDDKETQT
ncbi:MAG: hypothetical protein ACTSUT_01645 [Promethearchaeota archaeon]